MKLLQTEFRFAARKEMKLATLLFLFSLLSLFSINFQKNKKMSSPPATEDAPVRSERPRLNLKPRDEGAAAKLATERAAAAKSVSFLNPGDGHLKETSRRRRENAEHRHSICDACLLAASAHLSPMSPM